MSMFLDTAKVSVKAGRGGDGMVAFRREKYVANGGPWGGDGGKGGSVIFKVDEGLRTLMDFRYNRIFKAKSGEKGMTKGMHGRGAEEIEIIIEIGEVLNRAVAQAGGEGRVAPVKPGALDGGIERRIRPRLVLAPSLQGGEGRGSGRAHQPACIGWPRR